MYVYNAKCERVVDGDTVDASIDLGFDVWIKIRIRLFGIDAYESRTRDLEEKEKGLLATERLIELLEKNNNEFILQSMGVGKYGRCLGVIYLPTEHGTEVNINRLLINEGHATVYE